MIFLSFVFRRFSQNKKNCSMFIESNRKQIRSKKNLEIESSSGKNCTNTLSYSKLSPIVFHRSPCHLHDSWKILAKNVGDRVEQIFDSFVMGHKFSWPSQKRNKHLNMHQAHSSKRAARRVFIFYSRISGRYGLVFYVQTGIMFAAFRSRSVMLREMWTTRISVAVSCNFSLSFSLSFSL